MLFESQADGLWDLLFSSGSDMNVLISNNFA